jgi:hypothetical protein
MRRWTTWLLLGALAALASVAVADAVRGRAETRKVSTPRISVPLIPRNEPAASAMSGTLYYTDAKRSCFLAGITLPDLRNPAFDPSTGPPPKLRHCRFSLSPDGQTALPGDVSWSPLGGLYARQAGDLIELGSPTSGRALHFPGHAPAFKPDGTFTYAQGDEVVEWTTSCPRGARLFTLPADNATARCARTVARVPNGPVRSLAWLTNTRMALITKPRGFLITIRDGRLHVSTGTPGHRLDDLQVSPRGTYVSARAEGGGLLVIDADGRPVALPPFLEPLEITWSPDERWTAVATARWVFLFRTAAGSRIRRLPIVARDLAWR